jgi:hypothetical protein
MRQMVEDGDMDRPDFIRWMLDKGYLEDGTSIGVLFHSQDPLISALVNLDGIDDPLVFEDNDKDNVIREIHVQQSMCLAVMANSGSRSQIDKAKQAIAALDWLVLQYEEETSEVPPELAEFVPGADQTEEEEEEDDIEEDDTEEEMENEGDDTEQERD